MSSKRLLTATARQLCRTTSRYSSTQSPASTPQTSPFAPRHLLSIADLTPQELTGLIRNAFKHKSIIKSGYGDNALSSSLFGKTIALMFSKRSTRTRVSMEAAINSMHGSAMFLGKDDIQLGVNESLYDTSVVISSMVEAIIARVGSHQEIADLAKNSSVPVINALSDDFHPMQSIADYLTISEAFPSTSPAGQSKDADLGLSGLKIAWVGDANNVLYDLAIGAQKLGVELSVATPKGYEVPEHMRKIIQHAGPDPNKPSAFTETNVPEEAVKDADVIVTDTWVSMGRETEEQQRIKDFANFQVTADMARRGGAKEGWQFMHCLPRKPEEVEDAVFYSKKSLVFQEAENRLWSAIACLEAFVVNKGKI